MFLPKKILEEKLLAFLKEDLGLGDVTTNTIVAPGVKVEAAVVAKEAGVAAGIEEALILLESLNLKAKAKVSDGEEFRRGSVLLEIAGDARTILSTERVLLNVLSRMSGIATQTRKLVEKLRDANFRTVVASTRKTAPGLAYFDKKAVKIGGGDTHRLHLDSMVLIKDNHIAVVGSVAEAVKKARETVSFSQKIEVEVSSVEEAVEAAEAGADIIMLDNFSPAQAKKAIKALKKRKLRERVLVEASGGINEDNILKYASAGVDIVSVGALTHSSRSLDMSLEVTDAAKIFSAHKRT